MVDRASADDPVLAERIRDANFIYLSGGKPDYLLQTSINTRALEAILDVYRRGGILAGCSAGAMVMGESIPGMLRGGSQAVPKCCHHSALRRDARLAPDRLARCSPDAKPPCTGLRAIRLYSVNGNGLKVIGRGSVTVWAPVWKSDA